MEKRKSLLFWRGVVVALALLTAVNVFAQSSCTSETVNHTAGNIIVNVAQTTTPDGKRSYKYTMTNAPGKTGAPNKFFVYVRDGLENDLSSTICNSNGTSCSSAAYLDHNETVGGFPAEVWRVNSHEDGVGATSVAIDKVITINVPERLNPQEQMTTVVLGVGTGTEHCGPLPGPTGPAALDGFLGSPLVSTVSRKLFENGCAYFVTAGETDNIVQSMTPDPATPFETVCGPSGCKPCVVANTPHICETELGLVFCPPGELGRPPLQSVAGGTCYYPPNLKFTC
jgi:hypothetical protein